MPPIEGFTCRATNSLTGNWKPVYHENVITSCPKGLGKSTGAAAP
jgi:hypothetical protein